MPTADELPHYFYKDYVSWKGDWELIKGIPYAMTPSPTIRHQYISQKIARYLDEALDDCPQCQALLSVDWIISDDTVVQPDNLVICHREQGDYLTQAPQLIFKILSPSSTRTDRITKFRLYEQEGVRWYCLVDPEQRVTKIHRLEQGKLIELREIHDERQEFDLNQCRIEFDFSRIWPARGMG